MRPRKITPAMSREKCFRDCLTYPPICKGRRLPKHSLKILRRELRRRQFCEYAAKVSLAIFVMQDGSYLPFKRSREFTRPQ